MFALERMPEMAAGLDLVHVPPPDAGSCDVPRLDKVGHDALRGALGDADVSRDVAEPNPGITRDAQKHMRVVREEGPASWVRIPLVVDHMKNDTLI